MEVKDRGDEEIDLGGEREGKEKWWRKKERKKK